MREHVEPTRTNRAAPRSAAEVPPQAQVVQVMMAPIISQAVFAAASLGLSDHLASGPLTVEALARLTGADPDSLGRLLRALSSVGIFELSAHGEVSLTPLAACLKSAGPESLRDMVLMMGSPWRLRAWEDICHSIRTGGAAFDHVFGMGPFEYFRQNADAAAVFHRAMVSYTASIAPSIARAYDFGRARTLVDVGGGHGYLLATILRAYPRLRGILFDLPEVVKDAPALLEQAGVAERCQVVPGSFFESVAPGGDVYLMKQIIHDWNDERALTVLRKCHAAMPDNATLLLAETVIPEGNEPAHAKLLDLEVLVALGGRERTEAGYRKLYADAGFRLARIIPTQGGIDLVEGVRA